MISRSRETGAQGGILGMREDLGGTASALFGDEGVLAGGVYGDLRLGHGES